MVATPTKRSLSSTATATALSKCLPRMPSSVSDTRSSGAAVGTRVHACHDAVPGLPTKLDPRSVTTESDITAGPRRPASCRALDDELVTRWGERLRGIAHGKDEPVPSTIEHRERLLPARR